MESLYLKHDIDCREDEKIIRLLRIKGFEGYGIYWMINEFLFKHNGKMFITSIPDIAYQTRIDESVVKDIIENYGLYKIKDGQFYSDRLLEDIGLIEESSKRGRDAANSRWNKSKKDAEAMHTHSGSNAIREEEKKQDNLQKFFLMALSDKQWMSDIIRKHSTKISEKTFEIRLNEFILNLKATKEHKNNYKDFCSHFSNWLGLQKPLGGSKLIINYD